MDGAGGQFGAQAGREVRSAALVLHREVRGGAAGQAVPVAVAQPPEPQHPEGRVDAPRGVGAVPGAHRPRQQVGRDDQDAARPHRQLHQKPLELHHEEKERRTHGPAHRYTPTHADLILRKKLTYLTKNEASEHFVKIERELLAIIYDNKENVIKIKDKNLPKADFGEKKKMPSLEEPDRHATVTQNRIIENQQFHSKTTEKFVENENRLLPFSSLKKS